MGRIPPETIEEILAKTDIVDLIDSYVPLKRSGSNFKCNCPFHDEKTPSFNVNQPEQYYKCFGCGAGGNAISFLIEYENLPFLDAVKKLASRAGVPIVEDAYDPEADRRRRRISRVKELNNKSARFFHRQIMKSPDAGHARDYLKSRGFTKETAEKWLIGWAPQDSKPFLEMAREAGFNGREIIQAGLGGLKNEHNPRAGLWVKWRDQLTFPIQNDYGDVVGFSARILREDDKRGKYINTSESPVFKKSKLLFALDKARRAIGKAKFAIICEGQIDAIVLHENGIENTVAPLGTAFTESHAQILKRYTNAVTLCYDGDAAGLKAANRAFDHLAAHSIEVRLIILPEGHDPDTYLQEFGLEKFKELLEEARDFFDARLDHELSSVNLSSASERAQLLKSLAESVATMSDALVRDATIQNLAIRLRLGTDEFRQAVGEARKAPSQNRRRPEKPEKERIEATAIDPMIAYLCHLALHAEDAAEHLREQLEGFLEALPDFAGNEILQHILHSKPNPERAAARQAYLMTIPEADRLALEKSFTTEIPKDPAKSAADTVAMLLAKFYQRKETVLRARQSNPDLSNEEKIQTMKEVVELQSILKELRERF